MIPSGPFVHKLMEIQGTKILMHFTLLFLLSIFRDIQTHTMTDTRDTIAYMFVYSYVRRM